MSDEREDLDALLRSEGWGRFQQYVEQQWGTAGVRFLRGVHDAADNVGPDATEKLRQVIVAQREITRLVEWPRTRLQEIARPQLVATGDRRGGL